MQTFRRLLRSLLLLALTLLVVLLIWLFFFFDLNDYRAQLSRSLSNTLGQQVRIESVHFAFIPTPSIDFRNLRLLPSQPGDPELGAEHLYLEIKWRPLLSGRVEFARVTLDHPVVELLLPEKPKGLPEQAVEKPVSVESLLHKSGIRHLRLKDGELRLGIAQSPEKTPLRAERIDLELREWGAGQTGEVNLSAELTAAGQTGTIRVTGRVSVPQDLSSWKDYSPELRAAFENLVPAPWLEPWRGNSRWRVTGMASGELHTGGSLGKGLALGLQIASGDLEFIGQELLPQPIPLSPLQGTAVLRGKKDLLQVNDLQLSAAGLQLRGGVQFRNPDEATGVFLTLQGLIDLRKAGAWLLAGRDERITSGQLKLSHLFLELPVAKLGDTEELVRMLQVEADVEDLGVTLGPGRVVHSLRCNGKLAGAQFQLAEGHALWSDLPLTFAGNIDLEHPEEPKFDLTLEAAPDPRQLADSVPISLPEWLDLSGPAQMHLNLKGTLKAPEIRLKTDLRQVRGGNKNVFIKPAGDEGSLTLFLQGNENNPFTLSGQLNLPPVQAKFSGNFALGQKEPYSFQASLAAGPLEKTRRASNLLERLQLQGELIGNGSLRGSWGEPPGWRGDVTLQDFGVHLTSVLGDLNQVRGRVRFADGTMIIRDLSGRLGESPVEIHGGIPDLSKPQVTLEVRSPSMRAHDLIFPSDQHMLRNLEGELEIDGEGIRFRRVTLQMEGGTDVVVRGHMAGYHHPHVVLDIEGSYGNVDEVIALWHHPRNQAPPAGAPSRRGGTTVDIQARADKGHLDGLKFTDATARIRSDGEGHLVIFPLHFRSGDGLGTGQVSVDSSGSEATRLSISGHVEDMDAAVLHQDLLRRKGLVTGSLQGDFFLEGNAGEGFLSSVSGGIDLQIEDGVLRRFRVLSKIFSLLNVSQILTFQLPDMATEGMPFTTLKGSAKLQNGMLETQDLFIRSEAMDLSLVGEVNLPEEQVEAVMGVKPLKTVDQVISKIPLAGWILTGESKALLTAYFRIQGDLEDPLVTPAPVTSISSPVIGIFKRVFQLPGKLATDIGEVIGGESSGGESEEKAEPSAGPGR